MKTSTILGVNEGIKFTVGDSKTIYKIEDNKLLSSVNNIDFIESSASLNYILENGISTCINYSALEVAFFQFLSEKYGFEWLARDKDGTAYFYKSKPYREEDEGFWETPLSNRDYTDLLDELEIFTWVQWKNEPICVDDVKIEKIEKRK